EGVFSVRDTDCRIAGVRRRGARVVDRDGLENRCTGNRTEGSNPSLSAKPRHSSRPQFRQTWPIAFSLLAPFSKAASGEGGTCPELDRLVSRRPGAFCIADAPTRA